jgi:excinuclease ABC subunit A
VKFEGQEVEDLAEVECSGLPRHTLNPVARAVKFHDEAITDMAQLSVSDVRRWVQSLELRAAKPISRATGSRDPAV